MGAIRARSWRSFCALRPFLPGNFRRTGQQTNRAASSQLQKQPTADLVDSSKHFGAARHSSRHQRPTRGAEPAGDPSQRFVQYGRAGDTDAKKQVGAPSACMLHLFQRQPDCSKCSASGAGAFRNPYFADPQQQQQQQLQNHLQAASIHIKPSDNGDQQAEEEEEANGWSQRQTQQRAGLLLRATPHMLAGDTTAEQMHFIENHIANLHSRQVTSSVKELSSLGYTQPPTSSTGVGVDTTAGTSRSSSLVCPAGLRTQVVDLTSQEHRARVLQDPREGDLIAVDLIGHDIIGLGFDICGDTRDGILVRAVHSRGPARESGAIQPGDRIKCLNVAFEQMTLQDASDLLNCAAPYKMRLLVEKRVASERQLNAKFAASSSLKEPREPSSPLASTKGYLRRLTSRLTGSTNQGDEQLEERSLQLASSSPPLGSAAARQLRQSSRGLRTATNEERRATVLSHDNEAFSVHSQGSSGARRESRRPSVASALTNGSFEELQAAKRLHKLNGPQATSSKMISVDLRQLSSDDDDDGDDDVEDTRTSSGMLNTLRVAQEGESATSQEKEHRRREQQERRPLDLITAEHLDRAATLTRKHAVGMLPD